MGQIIKRRANIYSVVSDMGEVVKVEFYIEHTEEKWWLDIFLDGIHFTKVSANKLGMIEEYINYFCERYM